MAADYYEILGVARTATQEEIKRAYRRLARELHPDATPGDPAAEARFKEVSQAYNVLRDPERRQRYDMFGPEGARADDPFGGGVGDVFDAFFGGGSPFGGRRSGGTGPPRGSDIEAMAELTFEEAVFGTEKEVTVRTAIACERCEASGAEPGHAPSTCPDCGGAGQVRRVRQSILGQMVTATQGGRCGGSGQVISKPCQDCGGEGRYLEEKSYYVDIPAGVDTGSTLRLAGRGAAGPRGGGVGDLFVHVKVAGHDRFERRDDDLVHQLRIPLTQAALGAHIPFETLDGTEDLVIPGGTQSGRVFRLKGRGVAHVQGRGRGDLLVQVVVDTPSKLSAEEDELLRRLAELRGDDVASADDSLFTRIKSAFK